MGPSTTDAGRISEQNAAYRKGMVLGLTMAEAGILIIFVLLLMIALGEIEKVDLRDLSESANAAIHQISTALKIRVAEPTTADIVAALSNRELVEKDRFKELESAEKTLHEVAKALQIAVKRPEEDFVRLVRVLQSAVEDPQQKSALAEAKRQIDEMREALRQVKSIAGSDPAKVADQLKAQSFRIANQEGLITRYEKQIAAAGQGKGERPCWVQPDGKIDYLYDVVLSSNGIRLQERTYPERADERALLHMPQSDSAEILSKEEFLTRTSPLYEDSKAQNCRFFVVIYDGTDAHEKLVYKDELRTVEGHFYKRLDSGPPPF